MATNTRQARREAEQKRREYYNKYIELFSLLFHNSVKFKNLGEVPKRYLLRTLLNNGAIAYHKETKLYLPFTPSGIDIYGLPTAYNLIGFNGYNIWAEPNEVVILRANDKHYPIKDFLEQQSKKLVDFDLAIEQNLEAIKTMTIVECADKATLLSLGNLAETRQIGASVAIVNAAANVGNHLTVQQTGAQYLVDKLQEARDKVFNETLTILGIDSANIDKRERVQSAEVEASSSFAIDCLNALIDTFNHDAEVGGLSIRIKGNTNLIESKEEQDNGDKL